jgi:hypothetical protein
MLGVRNRRQQLAVVCVVVLGACSQRTTTPKDGGPSDSSAPDAPLALDLASADGPTPTQVVYLHSPPWVRVYLGGPNKPPAMALSIPGRELNALREIGMGSRGDGRGFALPSGGRLVGYGRQPPTVCGFIVVRPNGEVLDLGSQPKDCHASGFGSWLCDCGIWVQRVDASGLVATTSSVLLQASVLLVRTDGTKWAETGSALCNVEALAEFLIQDSLRVGAEHIYVLGRRVESHTRLLFAARRDCAARRATEVKLSVKAGARGDRIIVSESGKAVFFRGVSKTSEEQLMVLEDATLTVRAVAPLTRLGAQSLTDIVSVSPDGRYVAIRQGGGLTVYDAANANGGVVANVLPSAKFSQKVTVAPAPTPLLWQNADTLLFWAVAGGSGDLFSYTVSTDSVRQVTTSGGKRPGPYAGDGQLLAEVSWLSPSSGSICFLVRDASASKQRRYILCAKRDGAAWIDLTPKLDDVDLAMDERRFTKGVLVRSPGKLFFVGTANGISNVYSVGLDALAPARPVTRNRVHGVGYGQLTASADGTAVAYVRARGTTFELMVAKTSGQASMSRKLHDLFSGAPLQPPVFSADASVISYALAVGLFWQRTEGSEAAIELEPPGTYVPLLIQ